MRALPFAGLLVTWLCGCGADTDHEPTVCAQRKGTYRATYTERSGSCGPQAESIFTLDGQPRVPPEPCFGGEIRYSADNCIVTNIDIECPSSDSGLAITVTANGKYTWNASGSSGSGEMSMVLFDVVGLPVCASSYAVRVKRL